MEINKYALFSDIAETKNITKTGERKGYTQPGVSRILKTMENEIGFPLINRTKHGISLTPNAEEILPIVRKLLAVNEQLEQTISALKGLNTGHLTIASFASISRNWLPTVINEFKKEYPGINIKLLEGGTDDIVYWLDESIADIGLVSKENIGDMNWIPLCEDPLMAILPKSFSYSGNSFPIKELTKYPFVLCPYGTDYDIYNAISNSNIDPDIHFSSKDDLAIISMVANELGVSILPKLVLKGITADITAIPLDPPFIRELGIAYHNVALSPAAKLFIEKTQKVLNRENHD